MTEDEKTIVSYDASEPVEEKKNSSDTFRKVAIGGGIGILLGASAAAVAQTLSNSSTPDEDVDVEPVDSVNVAGNVSDGMSFGEAFAAARSELGPGGMFTWHGNSYSTYTADEWDGMSAAERAEYGRLVAPHVQFDHPQHVTHTVNHVVHEVVDQPDGGDVNIIVEPAQQAEVPAKPAEPEQPEEAITGKADDVRLDLAHVRVTQAEEVETFDDVDTIVGKGFVDGHDAMFHDLDNNGVFDAATVDANDNHTFIDDQKYDISDLHLSTQNVEAEI